MRHAQLFSVSHGGRSAMSMSMTCVSSPTVLAQSRGPQRRPRSGCRVRLWARVWAVAVDRRRGAIVR